MALTNEEYEKIRRILEERRLEDDHLLSLRRKEVYGRIPEYRGLEDRIASLSMECSRSLITEKSGESRRQLMDTLHGQLKELRLEKKRLLEEHSFAADYLDGVWQCPKCRDTGFVDGEKCSCFKQLEIDSLYDASHIRLILEQNNFSLLSYDYYKGEDLRFFQEAVKNCHAFIDSFRKEYKNLLLYGTVGTGKSFLSGCVAKELLDKGFSIIYFSAQQLFQSISAVYYDHDKSELQSLYERIYGSDLLIIDDLGTEMVNEFTRTQLFTVLNERALRRNPVIISTNLDLENIRRTYSDRLFSRLADNCRICRLSGKDIRLQKKLEAEYLRP
ncbi:MAG: ATP-binding protein [Lachnospiraceae bacterium]|nr:ATP-binding protein [Lachnospiraceae bacterium]